MGFKQVNPSEVTQLQREIAAEHKVQRLESGNITLPTKCLYVLDPDKTPVHESWFETHAVGKIEYPLDFCPMDSGACSQGGEADGFYHVGGGGAGDKAEPELWIHSCYRPTRKWFTGHILRVVSFVEGYELPW